MKKSVLLASIATLAVGCAGVKYVTTSNFKKTDNTTAWKVPKDAINYSKLARKNTRKAGRKIASSDEGLTPNNVHYRENGKKPEIGRSGGRTIESWGLLDKSGKTTVYVTTGSLNEGTTEDDTHISKVQFKVQNSSGTTVFNQEFNQLVNDGEYSFTSNKLTRSQKFNIMSHVSKDGEKRNFVVSTTNRVYLLPDLKGDKIETQSEVYQNAHVLINAHFKEVNGDLGAEADCVLYVDGNEAERAPQIWVDAADSVVCQFDRTFDTVGSKSIVVKAENVKPADYDLANNSVSATINVVNNRLPIHVYNAQLYEFKEKYHYKWENSYGDGGAINYDYDSQQFVYQGLINETLPANVPWVGSAQESSGTQTLVDWNQKTLTDCYEYQPYFKQCLANDYSTNAHINVVTYFGQNQTYVYFQRYYYKVVYYGNTGSYSYLDGRVDTSGQKFTITNGTLKYMIGVQVGEYNYVDENVIHTQPINDASSQPWTCYQDYYGYRSCWEYSQSRTGQYGTLP